MENTRSLPRCPECGLFGSPKRNGYCKTHDPIKPKGKPEENVCFRCGEPAYKRNDEYEGCSPDWLCEDHYIERCGVGGIRVDAQYIIPSEAPPCEQCGQPGFRRHANSYVYCQEHYMDRINADRGQRHVFNDGYDDKFVSDRELVSSDKFEIIKDKVGYVERG